MPLSVNRPYNQSQNKVRTIRQRLRIHTNTTTCLAVALRFLNVFGGHQKIEKKNTLIQASFVWYAKTLLPKTEIL